MVLLRMRLVQIKMRRTKRGSADPGRETRARSTIIGVGNNVGIGVREWFFVSMTYAVWCARRAVAFAAISSSYTKPQQIRARISATRPSMPSALIRPETRPSVMAEKKPSISKFITNLLRR